MDDIKAIRDALAVAQKGGDIALHALYDACHPERIARLLDALELAQRNAERYRTLRSQFERGAVVSLHLPAVSDRLNREVTFATPEAFDAAIDAAMAASAPESTEGL